MTAAFTATPVIWVRVEDSDGAFVAKFLRWLAGVGIDTFGKRADFDLGVHSFAAGFAPDDAERVIAWLRENGCEERRSG